MPDHKGLQDWIELFRTGRWADSRGVTRDWAEEDLDQVVANHATDRMGPAPVVIGHPTMSDPAYGWTTDLKREGGTLLGRFGDLVPEFVAAVDAGHYRKRSVRLLQTDDGWALGHVGFLGAAPPAVSGLKALEYQAPQSEFHDFVSDWWSLETQAGLWRRLKNWLIGKESQELADQLIPEYELDTLKDAAAEVRLAPDDALPESTTNFNRPQEGGMPRDKTFTQADLDQAAAAAKTAAEAAHAAELADRDKVIADHARRARQAEFQALVDQAIDAGVPPALLHGAADFAAGLPHGDEAQFDFSTGENGETRKAGPLGWFRDHLTGLKALRTKVPLSGKPPAGGVGPADFSAEVKREMAEHGGDAATAAQRVKARSGG